MVNLRVTAVGKLPAIRIAQPPQPVQRGVRRRIAWFPRTGTIEIAVFRREELVAGAVVAGPCILDAFDCTSVIPPGWAGTVDGDGYIHVRRVP
jgi:N-methylhydantoinase A